VTQSGLVIDRDRSLEIGADAAAATDGRRVEFEIGVGEREVRKALRRQIARLERESSAIVANGFPHIPPAAADMPVLRGEVAGGPCLLTLAELERLRDRLAGHTQNLRRLATERREQERRARELLEGMKLEPGRYKFVRLPVRDLGEGGCGVWHVRPRLGLIGMLAGWWHVKLSSGCPLPRGPRVRAAPDSSVTESHHAGFAGGEAVRWRPVRLDDIGLIGRIAALGNHGEHRRERTALAVGHRPDRLLLGHRELGEEFTAACLTPTALAHQQVGDRHRLGLPRAVEDHRGDAEIPQRDSALERSAGETDLIGAFQGAHVLRTGRGNRRRCRVHVSTLPVTPGERRGGNILALNFLGRFTHSSQPPEVDPRDESRTNPGTWPPVRSFLRGELQTVMQSAPRSYVRTGFPVNSENAVRALEATFFLAKRTCEEMDKRNRLVERRTPACVPRLDPADRAHPRMMEMDGGTEGTQLRRGPGPAAVRARTRTRT